MDVIETRFLRVCDNILQAIDGAADSQLPMEEYLGISNKYVNNEFPNSRGIERVVHWVLIDSHAMALSPFVYDEKSCVSYVTRNGGGHDFATAMDKYRDDLRNRVE